MKERAAAAAGHQLKLITQLINYNLVSMTNYLKHEYSTSTTQFQNKLLPLGIPTQNEYKLQIFVGIIDILQPYNLMKKLESALRGIVNPVR